MLDPPKTRAEDVNPAPAAVDDTRAATFVVDKTAVLWTAALAIVWISSLEPTLRNVAGTTEAFREINASRQEAEGRVAYRMRTVIQQQDEIARLKVFEEKHPAVKRKDEADKLRRKKEQAEEKRRKFPKSWLECSRSQKCSEAEVAASRAETAFGRFQIYQLLLKAIPLAEREKELATSIADLKQESQRHKAIYAETRKRAAAQERDVAFELFGLHFKAPPLLAPLLWCVLCAALFAYLAGARGRARPLPERGLVLGLVFLVPFAVWIAELRVAWIALEFSRYLGPALVRAVLPFGLAAVLALTLWTGGWWFFSEGRESPDAGRSALAWLSGLAAVLVLLAACGIVAFRQPSIGIHFGRLLQRSLAWMPLAALGLLAVTAGFKKLGMGGAPAAEEPSPRSWIYTRRRLLLDLIGLVVVMTAAAIAPSLGRQVGGVGKRRARYRPLLGLNLKAGFYYAGRQHPQEVGGKRHRKKFRPLVFHYAGSSGRVSQRASLPPLRTLKRVEGEPIWFLVALPDALDQGDAPAEELTILGSGPAFQKNRSGRLKKLSISRVNLAASSWSFEQAALAVFRSGGPISRIRSREVCELLLCGIRHDLLYKQRLNKERKKSRPSFRLYDLLAGVCIRYRQRSYFEQLLVTIKDSGLQLVFQSRVEKWQAVNGAWRQRWRNRKVPIVWKSDFGAVVF